MPGGPALPCGSRIFTLSERREMPRLDRSGRFLLNPVQRFFTSLGGFRFLGLDLAEAPRHPRPARSRAAGQVVHGRLAAARRGAHRTTGQPPGRGRCRGDGDGGACSGAVRVRQRDTHRPDQDRGRRPRPRRQRRRTSSDSTRSGGWRSSARWPGAASRRGRRRRPRWAAGQTTYATEPMRARGSSGESGLLVRRRPRVSALDGTRRCATAPRLGNEAAATRTVAALGARGLAQEVRAPPGNGR